jgi:hypothetical protein
MRTYLKRCLKDTLKALLMLMPTLSELTVKREKMLSSKPKRRKRLVSLLNYSASVIVTLLVNLKS